MLTMTIYNQCNACLTGTYHTSKGECVPVEFMGTSLECECYVNAIAQDNDGSNEYTLVTVRDNVRSASPVYTGFALHNVWSGMVNNQEVAV